MHIIEAIDSDQILHNDKDHQMVLIRAQQIQDGGLPPSWKSKNRDISVTVWPDHRH